MLSETRKSILEIDAFLKGAKLGYLVVENNRVTLSTEDEDIILNETHEIEVLNEQTNECVSVTYKEALTVKCIDGWPLYAGKPTFVYNLNSL